MKLTIQERVQLNHILVGLERAQMFIMRDNIKVICTVPFTHMINDTWVNKGTGEEAGEITKPVGCDLMYIYNAINYLKNALQEQPKEPKLTPEQIAEYGKKYGLDP